MKKRYLLVIACLALAALGSLAYPATRSVQLSAGGIPHDGPVAYSSFGDIASPTSTGSRQSKDTCNDLLVLVDKSHGLPARYVPSHLVSLHTYGIPVNNYTIMGRSIIIHDLQQLIAAAQEAGQYLVVASAYRSYTEQASIFNTYVQDYGSEEANAFSARAGQSQHQLGTAVDFTTAEMEYRLSQTFGSTAAGQWLFANAYKYGFYLSYPQGQESITKYAYEPWHFRYLGKQYASDLHQGGLIMQTYLEKQDVSPHC